MDTFLHQTASFEQPAGFGIIQAALPIMGGGKNQKSTPSRLGIPVGLHKRGLNGGGGGWEPMVQEGGAVPDDLFEACVQAMH